ncbi:MAG TPA: alpha/beta hydrolase [Opitutaceae bacterium]|jgi:pimeloyl-ACP methyl ester carboxylesterase|nr:alpha/beta hydrolase [Opitutaceae bacterium]
MSNHILFIHGMFLNPKSWEPWIHRFETRDFSCSAPAWPLHEGDPRALRSHVPEGLGHLKLQDVVDRYVAELRNLDEPPILIGHSMGGLVVQILAAQGLASMGVCIASVAPNDLISADWGLFTNVLSIINPLAGQSPCEMTPESFHDNFCNTMTHAQAVEAFDEFAVHESRQVMRDSLRRIAHIDLDKPHVPLLFLSGEKDVIIPTSLVAKNADHYTDPGSVTARKEFPGRGHFLCGQPGWEDVADYVHAWILTQSDRETGDRLDRLSIADTPLDPAAAPIIRHFRIHTEPEE